MFRIQCWALLALVWLLGYSERASQAQILHDSYAIAETKADLPADWELYPETIYSTTNNSSTRSDHHWMGRRLDPTEPPSLHNPPLAVLSVRIVVFKTVEEARACLKLWTQGNSVPPVPGAYTSKNLGDVCFRGTGKATSASLWFCRRNVACDIHVNGPEGELNYPVVVEKIAHSLLARADAALALEDSGDGPLLLNAPNIGIRHPRGASVELVDEWAAGAGGSWTADWKAGSVTVTRGGHTLILNVGSQNALLDGKPIPLAFPALRFGKDRLWCPNTVLDKLSE